jgi:8-oxo-dGTP pyrophosphatase MutT (NUDIX family)
MDSTWKTIPSDWSMDTCNKKILCVRCPNSCRCVLRKLKTYTSPKKYPHSFSPKKKAGVLMTSTDGDKTKILVVQSRGRLWGIPKGGIENGENEMDCAFRELYEETGIKLDKKKSDVAATIRMKHGQYFFLPNQPKHELKLADCNDSTGVGWITKDCLKSLLMRKLVRFTADFSRIIDLPLINEKTREKM